LLNALQVRQKTLDLDQRSFSAIGSIVEALFE
jgi:hypothetical protein